VAAVPLALWAGDTDVSLMAKYSDEFASGEKKSDWLMGYCRITARVSSMLIAV
jgi:hypothetical protein